MSEIQNVKSSISFLDLCAEYEKEKAVEEKKKQKKLEENSTENYLNYIPPNWQGTELDFKITVELGKILAKKKVEELTDDEKITVNNFDILKSCYCTPYSPLKLAKAFIGKFNFEPYDNPYSLVRTKEFFQEHTEENPITILDGFSEDKDGYNIKNWPKTPNVSALINPPFEKLADVAKKCNVYSQMQFKPKLALICNLDYNEYFRECMRFASYMIILGRVQFRPIPGIQVSSPRGSSALFIYNSKMEVPTGQILCDEKTYYCVNLKNKEIRHF